MMFSRLLGNNDSSKVKEEKFNPTDYEFTNIEFLKKFTFLNFYNKNIIKNNLDSKGILGNANLEKYFLFFYESYANQGMKNFKDIDIEQLRIDVNNTEDALIDESIAQLILVDKTLLSKYMNTPKASYETNNYNISEIGNYNVGDRIWGELCINDDDVLIQPPLYNISSIFDSCKTNNNKNIINVEPLFFIKKINKYTYNQLPDASNNSNDKNRDYYNVNKNDTIIIKSSNQNNLVNITLDFYNSNIDASNSIILSKLNDSQVSIIQDFEDDEKFSPSYEFFVILKPYVEGMNNKIVRIYENKSEIYETIVNINNNIFNNQENNPMLVIIVPNIQEEEEEEEGEEEKLNDTIKKNLTPKHGMYLGRGWKVYDYNNKLVYVKNEEECGLELPVELQDYKFENDKYYFNFEDEKITSKESNNKYKFKNDTCTNEVTIDGKKISKYIPNNIQIGDKIWWNNCDKKYSKNEGIVKNIEGNDIFVDDKTPIKKSQIYSYKSNNTLNIENAKKLNKQLQQLSSGIEIFKNHMSNERTIPLSINSSRSKNAIIAKIISDIYDSLIYHLNLSSNNNKNFLNLCIDILKNRKNDEIDFFNTGKSEEKRFKEEPFLFSGEFEDFPKHIVDINDILTLQHTGEYERIKYDNDDINNWIIKLNRISTIIQTNSQHLKDNLEKLEYWKLHVYIFYKLPIFIDYSLWDIGSNKTENYIELPFITDSNNYEINYYSAIENNDNTNSNNSTNTSYKYYITDDNKCSENTIISTSLGAGKINRSRLNQYKKKIIEIFIHLLRKCLDKLIERTTSPNPENPRFRIGNNNYNNINIITRPKIYKYITDIKTFALNHSLEEINKDHLDTLDDLQKYNETRITREKDGPLRSIYGIKQINVSSKDNIQQDVQQEIENIEQSKTSIDTILRNSTIKNSTIKNSRLKALNIRLNIEKNYLDELSTRLKDTKNSPLKDNNSYKKKICNIETRSKYNSLMNQMEISLNKFLDDENFLIFARRTYPNISDILQQKGANKDAKLNGIKILFLITFIHYQYKILQTF